MRTECKILNSTIPLLKLSECLLHFPRYILIDYREDGVTPYATIWKYGLEEEKV